MKLLTPRLNLRAFAGSDAKDLYEYLSDADVVNFEPYEPFTEEMAKQEAKTRAKCPEFIAVCLKDTGKLIGNVYLGKRDFDNYEIGYVFAKAFWHQGYATEAAAAVMRHAFEQLHAHRIYAECNPLNKPSVQLLKRLGMRKEAHLHSNVAFKNDPKTGEPIWQDTYVLAILADEWRKRQA